MLLDQYKIYNDSGVYEHYEYCILKSVSNKLSEISVGVYGMSLIEDYVSEIMGVRFCFSLLSESRFFLCNTDREDETEGKKEVVLDISLLKIDEDNYEIIADIIESGKVLMEIAGVVSVSAKYCSV